MSETETPWTEMELIAALRAAGWEREKGPARIYRSPGGMRFHLDEYRAPIGVLWRYYAARRELPAEKRKRWPRWATARAEGTRVAAVKSPAAVKRPPAHFPPRMRDEVFAFVVGFKEANAGDSPTLEEIAAAVGLRSASSAAYHVTRLEDEGRIERDTGLQARIRVRGGCWVMGVSSSQELTRLHPTAESMYRFIVRFKTMHAGDSPSRREIMAGVGVATLSMVQHHLEALEAAGLIERPKRGAARRIAIPGAIWRMMPTTVEGNRASLALGETLPAPEKRPAEGENKCAPSLGGEGADLPEEERKVRERLGEMG